MGGYPIIQFKHIGTEYIDADIFTKAFEYNLLIKYAASVVGLKESEEDKELVESEYLASRDPAKNGILKWNQ